MFLTFKIEKRFFNLLKMKKIIVLALLVLISVKQLFPQRRNIDSLRQIINLFEKKTDYSKDTNYIFALQKLAFAYNLIESDSTRIIASKMLKFSIEINNLSAQAYSNYLIGTSVFYHGNYIEAMEYYLKAQKLFELVDDNRGIAWVYNNMGLIYINQSKYTEAIYFMIKSLHYKQLIGDKSDIAGTISNIGYIYNKQKLYVLARTKIQEAIKIQEQIHDDKGCANSYSNIGWIYFNLHKIDSAELYFGKAHILNKKIGDKYNSAETLQGIAECNIIHKNYQFALFNALESWKMANETNNIERLRDISNTLSKIYEAIANFSVALNYHKLFKNYSDSMISTENQKKTEQLQLQYEFEKKENQLVTQHKLKDIVFEKKIAKQQLWVFSLMGFFASLLIVTIIIIRSRILQKRANEQLKILNEQVLEKNEILQERNEEINQQKEEIQAQAEFLELANDEITIQKNKIEKSHFQITSSIAYARRIQNAILPKQESIKQSLSQHFIFNKPRDIVSGDFYFFKQLNNYLIIAVADCTGHGVPGAFMSMLGMALLNEIVSNKEIASTNLALDELRNQIKNSLQQTGQIGEQQDGMDIALCSINLKTFEMSFSGAHNPCWIFHRENSDNFTPNDGNKLTELHADHQPVGIFIKERPFTEHKIYLRTGDIFYIFSDGYMSQFGGEKGDKFKTKRFKELLTEINCLSLDEQKQILETKFDEWKGKYDQTDDVLVMGVKI
jgi:serine phosphatase RsbU (regulator of sigma subunit)/tetratricopeptide (TPR) repeat protein